MFVKYPECLKDKVNGSEVGNGQQSFIKRFKACIENQLRDKSVEQSTRQRAVRAKGVVGVLASEYEPDILDSPKQQETRERLQNIHKLNPRSWDYDAVRKDMIETYELQREDIIKVKELFDEEEEKSAEGEDEDDVQEKALVTISKLWPFLFEKDILTLHHKRLTGRELLPRAKEFMRDKVDFFMMYLTSASSKSNIKNLALRIKSGPYLEETPYAPKKLLCAILMIANYFKEDSSLLFLPVEVLI